jgi:tetratricopeptide (TPR) repeat protein
VASHAPFPLSSHRQLAGRLKAFEDAVFLHSQGKLQEAAQRYEVVLRADDRHFDALYCLGLIRLQQGRFDDAANLFRRAVKINKKSLEAQLHLGIALTGLNRHQEAIKRYKTVLAISPKCPEAENNIGYAFQALGHTEQSIAHYQKALAIKPDYVEAHNNLGVALYMLDRSDDAIAHYEKALAAKPNFAEAHKNLANALSKLERYHEAVDHYEQALAIIPKDVDARTALGGALLRLDRPDEAIEQYERVLAACPGHVEARNCLGHTLHMLGQSQKAIGHFESALAVDPNNTMALTNLGQALLALGRQTEGTAAFEKSVALRKVGCYWNLAISKRFIEGDRHLDAMRDLAKNLASLNVDEQIDLHFALGKALADIGNGEQSFHHLLAGNALKRQQVRYDEAKAMDLLERIRAVFTAEFIQEKMRPWDQSFAPVLIVGMPRSGTTLVEQILASHPRVFGGGELPNIPQLINALSGPHGECFPEAIATMSGDEFHEIGERYIRALRRLAPEALRITDKTVSNFKFAGLIHLALPNARIIDVRRDMRDVAVSCFSLLFSRGQEFTYDLGELGRYCTAYAATMEHWRHVLPEGVMLEVQYEELVADVELHAQKIVAHCGLDWDDACLAFHKSERSVRTASATQVRLPIYRSSVGRWRQHAEQLQPLLQALNISQFSRPGHKGNYSAQ